MRKLLALHDAGRGGRRREDLYDLLGLRIIVAPRAAGNQGDALAEQDAVQVRLVLGQRAGDCMVDCCMGDCCIVDRMVCCVSFQLSASQHEH